MPKKPLISSLSLNDLNLPELDDPQWIEEVKGQGLTKKRNLEILMLIASGCKQEDVAKDYSIGRSRVTHIVRDNRALLDLLTMRVFLANKSGRLRELMRLYRERKLKITQKDPVDVISEIRKEVEGDKPLVQNNVTNAYAVSWDESDDPEDTLPPTRSTEGFSL